MAKKPINNFSKRRKWNQIIIWIEDYVVTKFQNSNIWTYKLSDIVGKFHGVKELKSIQKLLKKLIKNNIHIIQEMPSKEKNMLTFHMTYCNQKQ